MQRRVLKAGSSALALSCLAVSALAHVTLEVREAKAGAPYKATLRVPHGCDGSPTVKLRVQIPEGVIAVKPMPKAGWQLETVKRPYARSYSYHGAPLTEGVKEIAWSGRLADEHFDEFVFSGFVAAEQPEGALYVPVTQECETGEMRWTDIPAAGQDAHALKAPAPALVILAQQRKPAAAPAASFKAGALTIEAPWIRATPGGAKVAGAYMKITNSGKEPDRLTGGSFPLAGRFEVHEMSTRDGVMRMRELPKGLEIKPGASVELKPGGYHVMLMDLKQGLKAGETHTGTLVFEKAGTIEIEYKVGPLGGGTPAAGGHSHH